MTIIEIGPAWADNEIITAKGIVNKLDQKKPFQNLFLFKAVLKLK